MCWSEQDREYKDVQRRGHGSQADFGPVNGVNPTCNTLVL